MTEIERKLLKIAEMFDSTVVTIHFLTECRNLIYKAICPKRVFIIRLTSKQYQTKAQIESELNFQRYLFENNAPVTEPLITYLGKSVIPLTIENNDYFASAFSFAHGKNWFERVDYSSDVLFNIGKALGKIHALSKKYKPECLKRRMWYEQQEIINAERLFYNYSVDLYNKFCVFIDEMKKSNKECCCFGLTHGDFLMSNYLIQNNNITVIDFNECEYSWYTMDLAICIRSYIIADEPEKVYEKSDQAEFIHYNILQGYRTENIIHVDMIYYLNKYIRVRDYIEISQLLLRIEQGNTLCDIEQRLLKTDINRVLENKPFLNFKIDRVEKLLSEQI